MRMYHGIKTLSIYRAIQRKAPLSSHVNPLLKMRYDPVNYIVREFRHHPLSQQRVYSLLILVQVSPFCLISKTYFFISLNTDVKRT
jgi:hypothetical protein